MLARAAPFPSLLLAHLREAWYGFRGLLPSAVYILILIRRAVPKWLLPDRLPYISPRRPKTGRPRASLIVVESNGLPGTAVRDSRRQLPACIRWQRRVARLSLDVHLGLACRGTSSCMSSLCPFFSTTSNGSSNVQKTRYTSNFSFLHSIRATSCSASTLLSLDGRVTRKLQLNQTA